MFTHIFSHYKHQNTLTSMLTIAKILNNVYTTQIYLYIIRPWRSFDIILLFFLTKKHSTLQENPINQLSPIQHSPVLYQYNFGNNNENCRSFFRRIYK